MNMNFSLANNNAREGYLNNNTLLGAALTGLGVLANRNLRMAKPMFGSVLANKARQHGLAFKFTPKDINKAKNFFTDPDDTSKSYIGAFLEKVKTSTPEFLGYKGKKDYEIIQDLIKKLTFGKVNLTPDAKNFGGPVLDVIGRGRNTGNIIGRATTKAKSPNAFGSESKYVESQLFKGGIPTTFKIDSLRKAIRAKKLNKWSDVEKYIKSRTGGDFLLKPEQGARSEGLILPEDISKRKLMSYFHDGKGPLKNYIVQKYNPIQGVTRLEELANLSSLALNPLAYAKGAISLDTTKSVLKNIFDFRKPFNSWGSHEYRISALDGKVVPHSVYNKALGGGYYGSSLFYGKKQRMLEDFVQQQLNTLKKKNRQGLMGFDVAIGKDGKPFIIEANPVVAGDITQISGAVTDPRILSDIYAGIAGKNPYRVNRQLALTMAPGALLTGKGILDANTEN